MKGSRRGDQGDIANTQDVPKDPRVAGFVGARRAAMSSVPDPEGNREARRAYAQAVKRAQRKAR